MQKGIKGELKSRKRFINSARWAGVRKGLRLEYEKCWTWNKNHV
jgi:hypothetical protein